MKRSAVIKMVIGALCTCIFSATGFAQGDNNPDPLINLGLVDGAAVSGSISNEQARGIPTDILWDPSIEDWATVSAYHEYGMLYDSIAYKTKEDPLWWQVVWPAAKNINFITCSGVYSNQPQPTTGWAVQIKVDRIWQDLAKAHNGWDADTLRGVGYGIPTQTNWVWDRQLVWKGLEPVVTKGVRFTAYANPDSLADGKESFADSLWSFAWTGRDLVTGAPKATLIQYLDFSDAEADNKLDPQINLALLDEAVVSANFQRRDSVFGEWIRNQPVDILYDPVKDDYHNKNNDWSWFGYPYAYDAGFPEGPDDGFQYMIEWPVPKKINYFCWGAGYDGIPQDDTPWALQYWDGETWITLIDGIGGSFKDGDNQWPYTPGVGMDAQSIWMVPTAEAITTKKIRLAAWSDGIYPLESFHIRCRGGAGINLDDSENPFKAVLVQYAEISDPTAIEANDLLQPAEFTLYQNFPNPFNPTTVISYRLSAASDVELSVYHLLGQKVGSLVAEKQNAGSYQVEWDGSGFASGVYYYRIKAGASVDIKKMVFIK